MTDVHVGNIGSDTEMYAAGVTNPHQWHHNPTRQGMKEVSVVSGPPKYSSTLVLQTPSEAFSSILSTQQIGERIDQHQWGTPTPFLDAQKG